MCVLITGVCLCWRCVSLCALVISVPHSSLHSQRCSVFSFERISLHGNPLLPILHRCQMTLRRYLASRCFVRMRFLLEIKHSQANWGLAVFLLPGYWISVCGEIPKHGTVALGTKTDWCVFVPFRGQGDNDEHNTRGTAQFIRWRQRVEVTATRNWRDVLQKHLILPLFCNVTQNDFGLFLYNILSFFFFGFSLWSKVEGLEISFVCRSVDVLSTITGKISEAPPSILLCGSI